MKNCQDCRFYKECKEMDGKQFCLKFMSKEDLFK
jgi:hypothetical protein